jgi:RimJ/RimL family protein N-acetyltransferase
MMHARTLVAGHSASGAYRWKGAVMTRTSGPLEPPPGSLDGTIDLAAAERRRPGAELSTPRLRLRPWRVDDAAAALHIYGDPEVARRLSPALGRVTDEDAMRLVLEQWITEDERLAPPSGRWAIERRSDGLLVGGAVLLPLPPGDEDLEFGWSVSRDQWGHGYASEAGRALARWAFQHGEEELFAVVRRTNVRAAAVALRIGMEWVGETEKYYGLTLQVYRLRHADLTAQDAAATSGIPLIS